MPLLAESVAERLRDPFWPVEIKYRAGLLVAFSLAAVLRCIRLMDLFPVLVDEAIYLRWAEIIQHRHTWFISLLDAKPPLSYWIYAAIRLPFTSDPLLGNRLVSVAAGSLCVLVLYRIGFLCSGRMGGVITALLYSVLPFGVLYDHIAYTDSLVNLFGALLVWTTLSCFGAKSLSWRRTFIAGLTMGAALLTKTTILLFALTPLAIGLYLRRGDRRALAGHMIAIYAVAALFPLLCLVAVPSGPTLDVNNVLLHHTDFYTLPAGLLQDPLVNLRINGPLLAGYAVRYLTYPTLAAALGSVIALVLSRRYVAVVILVASALPLAAAAATLVYFPSRYAFPHAWPLLLVIGCAAAIPHASLRARIAGYAAGGIVFAGMAIQSVQLLRVPERALHERDSEEFLGSSPYSGWGVLDAIALLREESRKGPMTILTDPWWGPPTDAVFAYLNKVNGTRVYEAWWLQQDGDYPLVPAGKMPIWRSQYQRVVDGEVDFSALKRLYYITDSNYFTPADVRTLSPAARLIKRFAKPGGDYFVDVYRLN